MICATGIPDFPLFRERSGLSTIPWEVHLDLPQGLRWRAVTTCSHGNSELRAGSFRLAPPL